MEKIRGKTKKDIFKIKIKKELFEKKKNFKVLNYINMSYYYYYNYYIYQFYFYFYFYSLFI